MAVPEFGAAFIGEVFINRGNTRLPHFEAILVAEQEPAFPKIFVVGIDPAADVSVGIGPGAGLDVDAGTDETDGRTAVVGLD